MKDCWAEAVEILPCDLSPISQELAYFISIQGGHGQAVSVTPTLRILFAATSSIHDAQGTISLLWVCRRNVSAFITPFVFV